MHRNPARDERTMINRALALWGVFDALKDAAFVIREDGKSRQACLVTPELEAAVAGLEPLYCGLAVGDLAKHFSPTMEGADLFARLSGGGKYYVAVGENAEKLVLYGRDVMGDSVTNAASDIGENELVIITNRAGEAIGVGRTRFAGKLMTQKGKITVTTLKDAGRYLREEDGERQAKMSRSPRRRRS
ncbi:PUA domain-containing protein [Nitrososphaera sp.]